RIKAGLDQVEVAQRIGVSEGYIGNIENPKVQTKTNVRLLGRIAIALELNSYSELLPKDVLTNDIVKVRLEIFKNNTRRQVLDEKGNVPLRHKILSIEPLSDDEFKLFNSKQLPYLKVLKH